MGAGGGRKCNETINSKCALHSHLEQFQYVEFQQKYTPAIGNFTATNFFPNSSTKDNNNNNSDCDNDDGGGDTRVRREKK